ncbi:MAG: dihydroxyacetone kinase transcriptional activator DhaS [Lachnospiraceae bacterium]|nr:dihydroxyacetone kinase transcriptional activator DhaS [Lachnospiraceae bacterium]
MPNTNTTKTALAESLKKLVLTKRLEKITINDLTADCGISRMAFYYHFKDIYDLVEWVCMEDGRKALQDKKTYDTWQEGMCQVFDAVLENKDFILNVYRSIGREKIESYLYKFTYDMIKEVVEEKCRGIDLAADHKVFIADFYKYGFVGIMLDWISCGMKADYEEIVENMGVMLHGNIARSIKNFERADSGV